MRLIPLTQGKFVQVDDEDYDDLIQHKWSAGKCKDGLTFYAICTKLDRITMHQYLLKSTTLNPGDHKDGNGLNNQRYNLRLCTQSQNSMNQRHQIGKTSKFKGVCLDSSNKKRPWLAQIGLNNKRIYLGCYYTENEAALAYNQKAKELFGEFARLNEVE